MQARHFSGYQCYDPRTRFGLSCAGFRGFSMPAKLREYRYAVDKAFSLIRAIESGQAVNSTVVKEESENRPVDHYNLRLDEATPENQAKFAAVPGKSLQASLRDWERISGAVEALVQAKQYSHVIFNGIGGSYLGPFMLLVAKHGDDYNEVMARQGRPSLHFSANTDSESFSKLLAQLDLSRTLMVVISKSGSTAETATNMRTFMSLLESRKVATPETIGRHLAAITTAGSKLDALARAKKFALVENMHESTGGRTSVCSPVGMVPCAFAGVDFAAFITGMSHMDELTRRADAKANPALLYAIFTDAYLRSRSVPCNTILLAYSDALKHYAHYCQQLYMESLGKEYTAQGLPARVGLTVFGGVGTGEQHAFMQQVQKGVGDSIVRLIKVASRCADFCDADLAEPLSAGPGSMGRQLLAFLKGTEIALYKNERPFCTLEVPDNSEYSLGLLVAFDERVVTILSSFWSINAFDQPGVQDGKLACGTCNELSREIEEALRAHFTAQSAPLSGKVCDIVKALGLAGRVAVDGELGQEDLTCWLAESVLNDICDNLDLSYPKLRGAVTGRRTWVENHFTYEFAKA